MPDTPTVLLDSFGGTGFGSSWRFEGYLKTVSTHQPAEVPGVLDEVERAATDGLYAVGFVAYEAAAALNPDLPSLPAREGLPLIWFALFRERRTVAACAECPERFSGIMMSAAKGPAEHAADVARIHSYIAAGDCYQVNHTFPLQGTFKGNLRELYSQIGAAQQAPFCSYLDIGRFSILSASPELFFSLKDGIITTRPMKGTARRGRWAEEDTTAVNQLRDSPKEMAENLMIVDLLRNDLGIIAETGSVSVDALFEVETYPTVHQMTSTVSAERKHGTCLMDIFQALFPCGSVTGAPKRRSMGIIAELEKAPRGAYCGAIGCVAPGGEAIFSVAIRTLLFDAQTNKLTMGVGSAVTWDSEAASEYAECMSKATFVNSCLPDHRLIESLRLEDGGYTLLDQHLLRLKASAGYFGFVCHPERIRKQLTDHAALNPGLRKVRLLLAADGGLEIFSEPLEECSVVLRVGISETRVASTDVMRFHKTTHRELLDSARAACPDCDEVLFLNQRGELTEGSYHTLVVKLDGRMLTPPLTCGLLPGVLRAVLLERFEIQEVILSQDDLLQAEELWLINSVRGWRRGSLSSGLRVQQGSNG